MKKDIDVIAVGYPSLDRIIKIEEIPELFKTTNIINQSNSKVYYGGCSVNIAYTASKLGVKSALMMRVGRDFEESGYQNFLEKGKVNLEGVEKIEEDTTSNSYLIENTEGNHITLFYPGAMGSQYSVLMDETMIQRAKYGVITVGNLEYNLEFARLCNLNNVPIIFGMKCDFNVFHKDNLEKLLAQSAIIFMNKGEEIEIKRVLKLKDISQLLDGQYCKAIVITRGKNGSKVIFRHEDEVVVEQIKIVKPKKVVDTAGVGDSYMAGFIYGLEKGYTYKECAQFGATVASFIIEEIGCLSRVPIEEELVSRYRKHFL